MSRGVHLDVPPGTVCTTTGPDRHGGGGYLCTRTVRHPGLHEAWLGGRLLDRWEGEHRPPGVPRG